MYVCIFWSRQMVGCLLYVGEGEMHNCVFAWKRRTVACLYIALKKIKLWERCNVFVYSLKLA